jgi:type IV secretion system protein VirB6
MFSWFGAKLGDILSNYVLGVVQKLMLGLTPIALTATTIWVLLYGWAVLRNEVSETVPTFVWKLTKLGLVLAFALQSGVYITNVADAANSLATGVASTFLPAAVPADTVTSAYQLLDEFNDNASAQVGDIMKEAGITRLDLFFAAGLFSVGSVAFLCVAVFIVTLATVMLNFVVAVGPVFILCLAWRPTQRFFDSWLSMLLNAAVISWFAFFALGLSAFVGREMFLAIQSAGGFLGTTLNVLGEATRYCVLMLVMAIICFQAPSLASALTGGAAVQQGVHMVQNLWMVAGLRGATSGSARHSPRAGGLIRAGGGLAYSAGVGVGRIARAAGIASHQAPSGGQAAYRRAALRGLA